MNIFPFFEVAAEAQNAMQNGATIYQQFRCAQCGTKQTLDTPNVFHTQGICEECDSLTDIKKDGCNFMCMFGVSAKAAPPK